MPQEVMKGDEGAELEAAADQVVLLGLQELVHQSSCDPAELDLQPGHVTAAQRQRPRPHHHCVIYKSCLDWFRISSFLHHWPKQRWPSRPHFLPLYKHGAKMWISVWGAEPMHTAPAHTLFTWFAVSVGQLTCSPAPRSIPCSTWFWAPSRWSSAWPRCRSAGWRWSCDCWSREEPPQETHTQDRIFKPNRCRHRDAKRRPANITQ